MGSQFTFLTYKYRDASFQVHPFLDFSWTGHLLNFTISPYEDRRTSLQVVNGSLYLFCTMARASAGPSSYTSYLSKIDTQDWTIKESDQLTLDLPPLFAPGVEVSDGNNLFIIGGLSSDPNPPYLPGQTNDSIIAVNVTNGQTKVVCTILGASGMHGLFVGNNLVLLQRSGDPTGGPEANYGSWVDWNSTIIYSMANKNLTIPKDLSSLRSSGSLPSSDGTAVYFFNPEEHNASSNQWHYAHEIWKMNMDEIFSKMDIFLPDGIQMVKPIRLGNGFLLYSLSQNGCYFWWCTL